MEVRDRAGNVTTVKPEIQVRRVPKPVMDFTVAPEIEGFRHVKKNRQGFHEYLHTGAGIVMVLLPGGAFQMGTDSGGRKDEKPRHSVTLDAFLIGKFELSQAEWERVMPRNPSRFKSDKLPVERVTWDECQVFCSRSEPPLRLPTEAEWEYACRAGSSTLYSTGDGLADSQANFKSVRQNRKKTVPVYAFAPNAFGLHNMHGNVWEWCQDVYSEGFYESSGATERNPECSLGSLKRVFRGGGWGDDVSRCRSAVRGSGKPLLRHVGHGFRPVFRLPIEEPEE